MYSGFGLEDYSLGLENTVLVPSMDIGQYMAKQMQASIDTMFF